MITHQKICLHCHEPFTCKRSDAKYCSGSCRALACIERTKIYWQKKHQEQEKKDAEYFKWIQQRNKDLEDLKKLQNEVDEYVNSKKKEKEEIKKISDKFDQYFKDESEKREIEKREWELKWAKDSVNSDISHLLKKNIILHEEERIAKTRIIYIIKRLKEILNSDHSKKLAENFPPLLFLKDKLQPLFENLNTVARGSSEFFIAFKLPEDLLEEHEIILEQTGKSR